MALQIKGKFISGQAVDGTKLLLTSGQAVRLMSASGEVRLIELDESTGKVKVNGVVVALSPDLVAEVNRAVQAEAALATDLATEVAARQAADSALSTAVQAAIQSEAAARVAADSALDSSLATEIAARQAGDSATLSSAQAYADQKVADLIASAPAMLDTLKELADAIADDPNFASTVAAQVAAVASGLSTEVSRATAAESALSASIASAQSAASAAVAAEQARAELAEAGLAADIAAEESRAMAAESVLTTSISTEVSRAQTAEASLQSQIDALSSGNGSLSLSSLDSRLDTLEGTGAGSVAKAEADAKAYADTKIAALVNSAPAVLDTLQELAAAINNDASFAATVAGQVGAVSSSLSAEVTRATGAEAALQAEIDAEESARAAAVLAEKNRAEAAEAVLTAGLAQEVTNRQNEDAALDSRLDALEARLHRKMKFVLSQTDIDNGYIELAHEAMENSIVAHVGRLAIHEGAGEDFEVSVVAGVSRMTFVGNLVSPSEEQLAVGDVIFVKYMNA